MKAPHLLLVLIMCMAAGGCTRRPTPVPRQKAFPRIEIADTQYHPITAGSLTIEVPDAADVSQPRPDWVNIHYPRYDCTIYLTISDFTDKAALAEAIDNRTQRISLDIGDAASEVSTIEAEPFVSHVVMSPESRSTPLHLLATDGERTLVYATASMPTAGPSAPLDSLAPIVDMLHKHLMHTGLTLKSQNR